MKKPFKSTEFSQTRNCGKCRKPLKMNLLHKKPKAEFCYKCFYPLEMLRRGVRVSSSGTSSVEYAIMVAGIAAAIILGVSLFGGSVKAIFDSIVGVGSLPH